MEKVDKLDKLFTKTTISRYISENWNGIKSISLDGKSVPLSVVVGLIIDDVFRRFPSTLPFKCISNLESLIIKTIKDNNENHYKSKKTLKLISLYNNTQNNYLLEERVSNSEIAWTIKNTILRKANLDGIEPQDISNVNESNVNEKLLSLLNGENIPVFKGIKSTSTNCMNLPDSMSSVILYLNEKEGISYGESLIRAILDYTKHTIALKNRKEFISKIKSIRSQK